METDFRTDAEVIADSLSRPQEFGVIFARHYLSVFRFTAKRLGSPAAVDAVSDIFLVAFRIRKKFRPDRESCLPWLYGISYNVVGDHLRRGSRRKVFLVADPVHVDGSNVFEDVDDRIAAQQLVQELNSALAQLAKADRRTFLLFALEGFTYSEISDALGIPVGTVGSRINRCRQVLRESIPGLEQILSTYEKRTDD